MDRIRMLTDHTAKLGGRWVRVPVGREFDVPDAVPLGVARRWVAKGMAEDVGADPLQGVPFASPKADELARDAGLIAADFDGTEPSGASGHTADDVRRIAGAEDAPEPEDG